MNDDGSNTPAEQLAMPGMPPAARPGAGATYETVAPGTAVFYVGYMRGGPRNGSRGVVVRARGRRALVDMGRSGAWHIPYYLLSVPPTAA